MSADATPPIVKPLSGIRASLVFFRHLFKLARFIWPIFSTQLLLIVGFGLMTGVRERWSVGDSLYYAFITAFTIGYGDLTPKFPLTKVLALAIGLVGFLFTGILVAITVEALRFTIMGKSPSDRVEMLGVDGR